MVTVKLEDHSKVPTQNASSSFIGSTNNGNEKASPKILRSLVSVGNPSLTESAIPDKPSAFKFFPTQIDQSPDPSTVIKTTIYKPDMSITRQKVKRIELEADVVEVAATVGPFDSASQVGHNAPTAKSNDAAESTYSNDFE